ncbi:MAG: MarR family winged helix-turn-helix transcriptional regulator [Streptosporangiaceae bacterium]
MSATPVPGEAGGPDVAAGRAGTSGPLGTARPPGTVPERPRSDLAAMIVPLARALVAAEEPVLRAHQVSMWGYVVLTALAEQPVRTQAALAQAIGADKSRIIGVLDELQQRGLIQRRPDPADRRVHLLSLTEAGGRLRESVREAIQRQEEERILAALPDADRAAFIRALEILSALPPEGIRG